MPLLCYNTFKVGDLMKRLFSIVIVFIMIFCLCGCEKGYESAPRITEGEFPFVLEYEINGERHIIEDTVVCKFDGYDLSNPFPFTDYSRTWYQSLKSGDEQKRLILELYDNTESVLVKGRINTESQVNLFYGSGGYYLGDPEDSERVPCINYVEEYKTSEKVTHNEVTPLTNEQLEVYFGIKIIRFEFSEPINNKFE